MDIVQVIISIFGSIALPIALTYLLREWISTRVRKSIQHEYDKKIEEFKSIQQKELEGYKAGYQKFLDENRVRFNWWHEEQAKAIKEFYVCLANLCNSFDDVISPTKYMPEHEDTKEKFYMFFLETVGNAYVPCQQFWTKNRIFFPSMDNDVEKLFSKYSEIVNLYGAAISARDERGYKKSVELVEELKVFLAELRRKFQEVMRGKSDISL